MFFGVFFTVLYGYRIGRSERIRDFSQVSVWETGLPTGSLISFKTVANVPANLGDPERPPQ